MSADPTSDAIGATAAYHAIKAAEKAEVKPCEHKWVFLRTVLHHHDDALGGPPQRFDVFFCERCLERRKVEQQEL